MQQNEKNKNTKFLSIASNCMPKDEQSLKILKSRAAQFSQSREKNNQQDEIAYIRFRLGLLGEYYGVSYQYANEVIHNRGVTKLPGMAAHIAGVINWRGALQAVVDLKQLFQLQLSAYTEDCYIIMVSANNMTIGFLADNIEGSDQYDPQKLDHTFMPENMINSELIVGLHRGNTAIINVESIMNAPQWHVQK